MKLWSNAYIFWNCARCWQMSKKSKPLWNAWALRCQEWKDIKQNCHSYWTIWVAYVTSELKQQSMEWRHSISPKKMKIKQTISARKTMCTVILGQQECVTCQLFASWWKCPTARRQSNSRSHPIVWLRTTSSPTIQSRSSA